MKLQKQLKLLVLLVISLLIAKVSEAQTRSGSINLYSDAGSYMLMNHEGSNEELQVLDGACTIEMWVKNMEQGDFNLFRFTSQSENENNINKFSLSYESDSEFVLQIKRKRSGNWRGDQKFYFNSLAQTTSFYQSWHHVALTYNNNKVAKLYIDGELMQTITDADLGGSDYSSLFSSYKNYDGDSFIGGKSATSDAYGRFYVGEVRLWKNVALSDDVIAEYYDNEVNSEHPQFTNLKYYYHGTDEYAYGDDFKFGDCANTYDGQQSESSVRISTDSGNTPPVRPPHMDDTLLGINFTASSCDTGQITLDWEDFHNSGTYLDCGVTDNRVVHYALFRDQYAGGTAIHTGTISEYVDEEVTGGQEHIYRLYTYWDIDGITYYSDKFLQLTAHAASVYAAPSDITATSDNCDGTITIDWETNDSPPYWQLERSINGSDFSVVSSTIDTTFYTEEEGDINSGFTYYYKVKAYGVDSNGCDVVSSYSSQAEGFSADIPAAPYSVTATADSEAGTITIDWEEPAYNIADSWIVERKESGSSTWTEIYNGTDYTFTQSGSDIEACVVYQYRVGAQNTCTSGIYYETKTANISYAELDNKITDLTASKGYYGDGVQLEWEIDGTSSIIETYVLERTIAGNNEYSTIATFDKDLVYRDYTALSNTLYEYRIQATASCNDTTVYTNDKSDVGFRAPYGIANGHVEYEGGNAVEGVKLTVEPKDGIKGGSLYFDGYLDYIIVDEGIDISYSSFCIEAWTKREEMGEGDMLFGMAMMNGSSDLEIGYQTNDYFKFGFGGDSEVYGPVTSTEWIHWACVSDIENDSLKIYMNGELVLSKKYNKTFTKVKEFYIGSASVKGIELKGYLDEIRVWDVARTADEIADNYTRVLNGDEDGLVAYWRCDEGFGSNIYDASYSGETYNKHDGYFYGDLVFSDVTPSDDELGIYTTTDENGDYSIEYIPYSGSGEIFKITPSNGQHQFSPGTRSVYIGDGAQTINSLDFTDISSFSVSGTVTYENSTYPVEGVSVLVDGVQAVGSDNSPVRTDSDGKFTIDVPIGYHYISVEKEGHTFSEGYFPSLTEYGDIDTYEFIEDKSNLEFTDNTTVKVLGRVVGGTTEGDKEIGFGLSTNNIGVAEIQFKIQQDGYDLDETDDDIYNIISTETDPYTGEYEVYLIPETWSILKVGSDSYSLDVNDLPDVDLEYSYTTTTLIDSTLVEDIDGDYYEVDTAWYNHKLNYIIREPAQITVTDIDGLTFDGDSLLVYTDQSDGVNDTINLNETDPFDYPCLTMGKQYDLKVFVYEEYINLDHPDGEVSDLVPVSDAEITIANDLMINPVGETGTTDDNGEFSYSFIAGSPNVSYDGDESFLKSLEIYATTAGETSMWGEDAFKAYVLGALPIEGTDFITYGPELVEMVLRDPPGSNSYAYVEKGSKYTKTLGWSMNDNSSSSLDKTFSCGLKTGLGGGLTGPMITTEIGMDYELGIQTTRYYDTEGNYTETREFTKRIETSSDPEDVGSDADVYIGKAYNAYMTESKNLKLLTKTYCDSVGITEYYPSDGSSEIVLGVLDGIVMDEGSTATYFMYSQKHIVYELIPELYEVRDHLLANSENYTSHFSYDHKYYGLNNDDNSLDQAKQDSLAKYGTYDTENFSYTFHGDPYYEMDSIQFLNDQITNWMNAIAINEADKVEAELVQNLSIDGSTGAYTETNTQSFDSGLNTENSRNFRFYWNPEFISIIGRDGYSGSSSFTLNKNISESTNKELENSVTFGYVIDERDEGDYYSIDVKKQDGVALFNENSFSDKVPDEDKLNNYSLAEGLYDGGGGATKTVAYVASKACLGKSNYFASAASFTVDLGMFIYEMVDIGKNKSKTFKEMDSNNEWDITGFDISSPIFTVRGGQSRCPYEGAEYSSFYLDSTTTNNEAYSLNIATLKREVPVIDVEQSLITDVPEGETADFVLKLGNESESNTDIWYELSIDESTNPDGAVLLIDGVSPEKQFLVPAWETLTKTLTLGKGQDEVFEYDSIGVILHSACQFDPSDVQADIADTVYISAHFQPECTSVDIESMQDNWILNYDDNETMNVTLTDYDVNHSTLDMLEFQYKTLTGNSSGVMAYFASDTTDSYNAYTGTKALIDGQGELNFNWDVSSLSDREYMIRARSVCTDGSEYESDWYTGLIDSKPPKVFGTPEPGDGILEPGEDISIRFDESLETGIINENNFSITGVLNGSDISHNTSLHFDGSDDYASVNSGIVLTDKSFTIEFWLRRDMQSDYVIIAQGESFDTNMEIGIDSSDEFYITVDGETFSGDPSVAYTTEYPWNSWHHYAVAYNHSGQTLKLYVDDQLILSEEDTHFDYGATGAFVIGKSTAFPGNTLAGNMHELRIWDDERSFGELYSNMSISLSGDEAGIYRLWEMNEGTGSVIADKVRNQVMDVAAEWAIEPSGTAVALNGTNQYLELSGTNTVIDAETDFTMEFWFKGQTPTENATLISNGKGDGIEYQEEGLDTSTEYCMSLTAQIDGSIVLNSNGAVFEAVSNNYFDNNWHHFALVIDRNANTSAYVDGDLQNSIDSDGIAEFAGAKIFVGARGYQTDPATYAYDQYFAGYMDEIRFWNTARTTDQLELYYNAKLSGDEVGLTGYYPFEYYELNMGSYDLTETWDDQWINPYGDNNGSATAVNGAGLSSEAAETKDARPVQNVAFDYVVNDDEIILTPTESSAKLENVVLEISVMDVYDLNGNRLLSPKNWTAYMDQNQVVWDEDSKELEKELYDALSFTTTIVNLGGTSEEYEISNLPGWLSASTTSGVIEPNEELEITFDVNEATNLGEYEQSIYLTTDFGYNEPLNIQLRVYEPEPEWDVTPADYEYSMMVVGQLIIGGEYSADEYDKIAAFAGDECRGVANVQYTASRDAYYVFLTAYSNSLTEDFTYKVWDASSGEIYTDVAPELSFESNKISGSISRPTEFECGYLLSSSVELNKGWTWVSFNRTMESYSDINTLFEDLTVEDGNIIKTKTAYAVYDSGFDFWLSSGLVTEAGYMYKVNLSAANTLEYEGQFIDADEFPVTISSGWNRIGYVPQSNIEINQALAGYQAVEGDVFKAQTRFALYDGSEWLGSLSYLQPGEGYMLWSQTTENVEFYYPNKSTLETLKSGVIEEQLISYFNGSNVNPFSYPGAVSITARINASGLEEDALIGAFIDNELRGVGKLNKQRVDLADYTMLTAFGDESDNGSELKFALLSDGEVQELTGSTTFINDDFKGTLNSPVELYLDELYAGNLDLKVYPNPFNSDIYVSFNLNKESKVTIELYNLMGTKVMRTDTQLLEHGSHTIHQNVEELPTGVYFITVKINDKVYQQKLVKSIK